MTSIKIIIISALLASLATAHAQGILTSEQAVKMAIDHNYSVQLAQQNIKVATNNATKENNGYLPTVSANVGPSTTFGKSTQQFSNGMSAETDAAFSWAAGAAVNANYLIYDQSRSLQLTQMKEQLDLTNLQLRQTIENTIFQVYNQYYLIAQLSEDIKAVEDALALSMRRKQRAESRYELSQGLKLDVLNAQVDISRDSVNYLNAIQQLENAKKDLEVIIGTTLPEEIIIDTNVSYISDLDKSELIANALAENVSLLLSDQHQQINQLDLDIIETINKPTIGSNAGFNYNYSDNAPGSFIASSTSSGLNLGLTLNWNIFDGGRKKVLRQNAMIQMETEALTREQIIKEINRDIDKAWGNYQNALYVLEVELNSLSTNRLNLSRTTDLFNAGQINSVDFRQAQLNLLNSETGYNRARFEAKLLELQLIYLSGDIMEVK